MTTGMEDEDKIDINNQELAESEHEEAHDKEATEKELVKVYLEDKKQEKNEEQEKIRESKDQILVQENIYRKEKS